MSLEILHIEFNEQNTHFVVGLSIGFKVYNAETQTLALENNLNDKGVGIITMIDQTNIFLFRGGGIYPYSPADRAILWNESKKSQIAEFELKSRITGLKANKK